LHDQPKLISATLNAVTLIVLSGGLLIQAKKAEKPENKTKDDKKLKAETTLSYIINRNSYFRLLPVF